MDSGLQSCVHIGHMQAYGVRIDLNGVYSRRHYGLGTDFAETHALRLDGKRDCNRVLSKTVCRVHCKLPSYIFCLSDTRGIKGAAF